MNGQPKSIWKKPLTGLRKVMAWLALFAVVVFVMTYLAGYPTAKPLPVSVRLVIGTVIAIFCAAVILFIRWLCCWRNFRRFLFGVACLVTVIALFYAEENWRGKHAWKKFKAEGEAKGEHFDLADIIPPPVPDEQNFAMAKIFVDSVAWYWDETKRKAMSGNTNFVDPLVLNIYRPVSEKDQPATGNWQKTEKTNLKAWQDYYRRPDATDGQFRLQQAQRGKPYFTNYFPVSPEPQSPAADVLFALSRFDSEVAQLRAAASRPYSRFSIDYNTEPASGILLPHLTKINQCSLFFRLHASAELELGEAEKAFEDVKLSMRLIDSVRGEPFLIPHIVRITMLQLALQPIWEGLADHKWNDAQLAALDAEFGKLDFLADYQLSMRGERALGIGVLDFLRRNRKEVAELVALSGWGFDEDNKHSRVSKTDFQVFAVFLIPSGWFERAKVGIARIHSEYVLPIVNLETRAFSSDAEKRADRAFADFEQKKLSFRHWFARLLLPGLNKTWKKFVWAQSFTDMARIAIALERYRLAHGNFPETLDALSPQFMEKIPHDIIGGKPLKYRRTDDGQFILYSVGWNETDDGRKVVLTKGGGVDFKQGDWVWRYPEK